MEPESQVSMYRTVNWMDGDCTALSATGSDSSLIDHRDMAMAQFSLRANPSSILVRDERAWPSSFPSALLRLPLVRLSTRNKFLHVQRTTSCISRRWRSLERLRCKPGRALGNATTVATTSATTSSAPQLDLQSVLPPSVLEGAPVLFGALVPVLFSMYLSNKMNLGLKNEIQVAVFRATAQLSTLGFALKLVFDGHNIGLSIVFMTIMVVVAAQTCGERSKLLPRSKLVSTVALVGGAFSTLWLMVLLKVFPLEAKYIIPATASLVGNSMTVVAITLNCIQHEIYVHKQEIEAALALGATPHQAINEYLRLSLIRGLGPIFDHMKVSGLVTLPGAMTGMLMSGSQPLEAVKTSLVLLYMLVGAASLSAVIGAQLGWRSLFSGSLQLL